MFRSFPSMLAIVCLCGVISSFASTTFAGDGVDKFIAERMARRANIDADRDTLEHFLARLSDAIELPIDVDRTSLQLDGITQCSSKGILEGEKPVGELLNVVVEKSVHSDRLTYIVAEDEQQRTLSRMRVVVLTRSSLRSKKVILRSQGETLGHVVKSLANQSGVRVALDDEALQAAGVSGKQVISVDETHQSHINALKIVADRAGGEAGQLVFVERQVPGEGFQLLVTTRAAVAFNGWTLPDFFREPGSSK